MIRLIGLVVVVGLLATALPASAAPGNVDKWIRPTDKGTSVNTYVWVTWQPDRPECNTDRTMKVRVRINYRRSGNTLYINHVELKNYTADSGSRVTLGGWVESTGQQTLATSGWGVGQLRYSQSNLINRSWGARTFSSRETLTGNNYLSFYIQDGHVLCGSYLNVHWLK